MIRRLPIAMIALQVGVATGVIGAVCSTKPTAREGILAMLDGSAARPFVLRSPLIRAIGWLGEQLAGPAGAPSAETSRRTIRYALFGLSSGLPFGAWMLLIAQMLAWSTAFAAIWWGSGKRLEAALVGWGMLVLYFTPGVMQHYDPFVVAVASGLAATALSGRWTAFAALIAVSGFIKESLPFFALLALPVWRKAPAVGGGLLLALVARFAVSRWADGAPGETLELHFFNNFYFATLLRNEGIFALLMPVWPTLVGAALWWGGKARPDRLAVGGLFAIHACAILTFGRTVESRTWLELVPLAVMLVAGTLPAEAPSSTPVRRIST